MVNLAAKQAEAEAAAASLEGGDGPGIASADDHAGHNHLDPDFVTGDILEDDGTGYDDTVGNGNFYGLETDYGVAKRSLRPLHRPMRARA